MNRDFFQSVLKKEEELITDIINGSFGTPNERRDFHQNQEAHVNANLLLTNELNPAFRAHGLIIASLISSYLDDRFREHAGSLKSIFQFDHLQVINNLTDDSIESIPALIEELHIVFLNSEFSFRNGTLTRKKSKHYLRETGAVYTLKQISNEIVNNTIAKAVDGGVNPKNITCLDFACGTGRFYFEAVEILKSKYNLSLEQIVCSNLFAVDIDATALAILRCKILSKFQKINSKIINAISTNTINRNALIPRNALINDSDNFIDFSGDFKSIFANNGFDVIFSNPPYCLLKVNKKGSQQKLNGYYLEFQNKIQKQINYFRSSGIYQHSVEGMLNYYQLSIEMIIRLTKPNGQIGIICPSSLFADLTSAKLRKHILISNKLQFIRYFPEAANLFDNVSQSTVIFYLRKGCKTDSIQIQMPDHSFDVNFSTIQNIFPANLEIPLIDKMGWSVLEKISEQPKLKEISFIRNKRGELDLTLFKPQITKSNTGYRLVRGNMISDETLKDKNGEFVRIESFLEKKSNEYKVNDYHQERLVCQQISNIDSHRRLKFVFCEKTDILGNSCNYIVSTRSKVDLSKLYYLLNSSLLNWRFKITSSNNHINNYELAELPIVDLDKINLDLFTSDESANNKTVCMLYGLTSPQTNYILKTNTKKEHNIQYEQETV